MFNIKQIAFLLFLLFFVSCQTFAQSTKNLKKLPTVNVIAESEKADSGYFISKSNSATKINMPLLDTPQAISVVSATQIADQQITNLASASQYVPGISVLQGESNRDQINIRGTNTTADFFVDQARDDLQYFRDFYNIENIEFLKGPNALAFGRGGSGGVVNRVSKYADGKQKRNFTTTVGSFNQQRISLDLADKISKTSAFRVNSIYEKSNTFRNYGYLNRYGINPTFTFNPNQKTEIRLGYEYFYDNRFNDRGLPSQNNLALKVNPKLFVGNFNENTSDAEINSISALVLYDANQNLQIKNHTRFSHGNKFYQNVYASSSINNFGNFNISAYNNKQNRNTITNQTDAIYKFKAFNVLNTALLGFEITKQQTENIRKTGFFNNTNTISSLNINNPLSNTAITYKFANSDINSQSNNQILGIYAQNKIDLNQYWQLLAGIRFDRFLAKTNNQVNNQQFSRADNLISPRFGIVFKPQEELSIYTSYSTSYLPSAGDQFSSLDSVAKMLKPEKLHNYELGAKFDLNKNLNFTSAIYQLDRKNTRANDPNNAGMMIATGQTTTKGLELSLNGNINKNWQTIVSQSWQQARVVSSTSSAHKGALVALFPSQILAVWNKYQLTKKFSAAAGVIKQGSQFAGADNTVKLKGFTRLDLATYYQLNENHQLQLNIENALNKHYTITAHNNNNLQPGSPLAIKLSWLGNF
jgi:catecholate siderophore receptor